jgi:hypothetical protein
VGSVVGVAVAVAIFQAAGPASSHVDIANGISHAFAVAGVAALAGAALSLLIVPRVAATLVARRRDALLVES